MISDNENFFQHEDERRSLIEWITDMPFRSAKVVIAKKDSVIGDHYHNKKEEVFFLLSGRARRVVVGDVEEFGVTAPKKWFAGRGVHHIFELEKGAVLLTAATGVFDPDDEIGEVKK